jgi:dipicolinate synthase subunit B
LKLEGKRIGFAMTGSFCTFSVAIKGLKDILEQGALVTPVISNNVDVTDTRFYNADELKKELTRLTDQPIIKTIAEAEPIGPYQLFDLLIVLPCTGNTLAKINMGITDTTVTMAVKSHLRNNRPVVLGVSTNDALGNNAKNIGALLNARNFYFIPFGQDDPEGKGRSMVLKGEYVLKTIEMAFDNRQIQPVLVN